jgi:ubiquitin-protein ligase E3 A
MSINEKKKLLQFVTGSDKIPVTGLKSLTFKIQKNGSDSDRLPTSHTCFGVMLLPAYSSKEKMSRMLDLAVGNSQGFGLR